MAGVEILHATVMRHIFDPHFHDSYLIGFTRSGVEQFHQNGKPGYSSVGKIRLIEPGVVHTGRPFGDLPWNYAAFYVSPKTVGDLDTDQFAPHFADAVVDDPDLFARGVALATHAIRKSISRRAGNSWPHCLLILFAGTLDRTATPKCA